MNRYRLSDVAPVFNLIQHGSLAGHFCNLYTQPRYMAGLGIQLFTLLLGRIRLPADGWYRATIKILRWQEQFAGFVIIRHAAYGPRTSELYMFAIAPEYRRNGLGESMLRTVLAELPIGHRMLAHCLPGSRGMNALLRKVGFTGQPSPAKPKVPNFVHRFAYS